MQPFECLEFTRLNLPLYSDLLAINFLPRAQQGAAPVLAMVRVRVPPARGVWGGGRRRRHGDGRDEEGHHAGLGPVLGQWVSLPVRVLVAREEGG